MSRISKNPAYKVDLRALHALCEANYARLLRIFPNYEVSNSTQFCVDPGQIRIDVLERSRYTTLFGLQCFGVGSADSEHPWLAPLKVEARAYHDAAMLEVVNFQNGGRLEGRYSYPNPAMHQQDEKQQQNGFLADWLSHCLRYGRTDTSFRLNPGPAHA